MTLRIAFAGTPEFAVPPLDALVAAGYPVVGVLTQPDRPKGRGRQLAASPVKQAALRQGLTVYQPPSLKTPEGQAVLTQLAPELLVVVAYGQILPPAALAVPRLGCINIHASLLPRWRGAAPIQRAILAGDPATGVTLMQMDAGLDTGAMLLQEALPITAGTTAARLHDQLSVLGAQALLRLLPELVAGRAHAVPQPDAGVTYAAKLDKAEARIDWSGDAAAIARQVCAFNPWPVADTVFEGEQLRIHEARAMPASRAAEPGTLLGLVDGALAVACGRGELHVTRVQRAGRNIVEARAFAQGLGSPAAGRLG